ncbi:MAG: hypothetical protein PF487_00955 [Bacteroidales bacterium]|jgi:hypothetical protein|nr:hypothetical protein [Bacteroidales bacterium]
MSGNTAFITYVLIPNGLQTTGNYSQAIHCNYIKKIDLGVTDPYVQEIKFNFPNKTDFKFLANDVNTTNSLGTGFTANKIYAVVQIVDNAPFDIYDNVKPDSTKWKQINITDQVNDYTTDETFFLTPDNITSVIFRVSLLQYTNMSVFSSYDLTYLDYPSSSQTDNTALRFGDETFFFGNVSTEIKADVYTTDLNINLPLNEFNSSTNKTWDGNETVYISEIGIYDNNKNLVGIGKLNDPVAKDSTIARTIVFALDF